MKIKFILLISSFIITLYSYSQTNESAYNKMVLQSIMTDQFLEQYGISEADIKNIEGSPYYKDNFQIGGIYNAEGVVASGIPMRYNIFADEIEMRPSSNPDDNTVKSLVKSTDFFAKIGTDNFIYILNSNSGEKSGYFSVLLDGTYFDLYKKTTVKYIKKKFAETNYQRDQPAKFVKKEVFYLVDNKGGFYELPSKRKSFISIFKQNSKELESYIKVNKLNITTETDMIKIVGYYNSLL
ncbi:MAG: hypothetical protein CVU03_12510 [Bacteroidetes bacterium HGW-Bacteroidetes-2]|nr:MAG: hypothetical protein CVU03_12510 [Bacteroidetes bacterium HGW-Bacteroidetes-2]